MDYLSMLTSKWGSFEAIGHCYNNGHMPFISEQARLNMLFAPENTDIFRNRICKQLAFGLPDELVDFYRTYNGCRLFFGGLNVFGWQMYPSEMYGPYDLFVENNHILGSLNPQDQKNCDLVFVASVGGDYAFGFEKKKPDRMIGIRKGSLTPVQIFPGFIEFFDYHFHRLFDEYDKDCKKIHPDKHFQGIPVLENLTSDI